MKKRRIFIAINLPEQIKKRLLDLQKEWADLPVQWTKVSNLHITLVFIGYVDDEEMLEICRLIKEIGPKHQAFEVKLDQVCLGPLNRPPRMIWAKGKISPQLTQLRDDLEQKLFNSVSKGFNQQKTRAFSPHITLARIRQREWRTLGIKPSIDKKISLSVPVASIEVMESHLSRDGAEYAVLESVELEE